MHWEILDSARKEILNSFTFLKSYHFYLAGGTALALHLAHRRSIDFDFYTNKTFHEVALEQDIVTHIKEFKVTHRSTGTIIGQTGIIDISFFLYSYPLLELPTTTPYFDICSVPDIAAMKLIALSQRGLRRDFLDLYMIAQQNSLEQIFQWTKAKFVQFDPYIYLKALTYFQDADLDESGRGMELIKPIPWKMIKNYFEREAIRLAKIWL